jgi:hypothetical protein
VRDVRPLRWRDKIGSRCPSVRYDEAHVWGFLLTDIETPA